MGTLASFDFGQPLALLALLAVVPAAWAARVALRRRRAADAAYGGPAELRLGVTEWRARARLALALLAIVALALALARPRWGHAQVPVERRGIDVVIALDVSRSMSAADVAPTRAQAAAAGLDAMIEHLQSDRVGLVTFAGTAFMRAPLTTDLGAISQLVVRAQSDSPLVRPGTDLAGALDTALATLNVKDAAGSQVIVLVSDGEGVAPGDLQGALQRAQDRHVRVYTVVDGTEAGGALTDAAAAPGEVSHADPGALQQIAQATGGTFRPVGSVAGLAVDFARMSQSLFDRETQRAPVERFQWFLGAALLLLVAQAALADVAPRGRPSVRTLALPGLALLGAVLVGCGGTALYRAVTSGNREYAASHYDVALTDYQQAESIAPDDPGVLYDLATTLHQLRRYEESSVTATKALATAPDPELAFRLQYLAGGTAFSRGALDEARTAYIAALRDHPEDRDAKANLELVLRALGQQANQQSGQQQGQGQGQDEPGGAGTGAGQGQQGPSGQPGQPDQGAQPGAGTPVPGGTGGASPGGGSGSGQPNASGTPGAAGGGDTSGMPGDSADGEAARAQAAAALNQALQALGPNVTPEEARRILELAQRANALEGLLPPKDGTVPAR